VLFVERVLVAVPCMLCCSFALYSLVLPPYVVVKQTLNGRANHRRFTVESAPAAVRRIPAGRCIPIRVYGIYFDGRAKQAVGLEALRYEIQLTSVTPVNCSERTSLHYSLSQDITRPDPGIGLRWFFLSPVAIWIMVAPRP
jgi:hypothetical protein